MTMNRYQWLKVLAMGTAVIGLPMAVMAHGPMGNAPQDCPPLSHLGGPMALPPHNLFPKVPVPGMFPELPPPGAMPPFLRGLTLTEAQEDKVFALMHAGIPGVRDQLKAGFKAMEELRALAASDNFDAEKARRLAETQAKAMAQVALMHAELDAKVRAILTPEQRKQFDDVRSKF
jgi:hypothetical protein